MRYRWVLPIHMHSSQLTEAQAAFIAGLPDAYCDLDYAIRSKSSCNVVARPSVKSAKEALRIGARLNLADVDVSGKARLSPELQRERKELTESEGSAEVAESELARQLLQRFREASICEFKPEELRRATRLVG